MTTLTGPELAPRSGSVKHLVIFLHGLGSDGNDLISLAPMLPLPDTQYVSPNAPFPCDMAPYGYQWFSLLDRAPQKLLEGARIAAPILNAYIDAQRDRFKLQDADIALVGFSQGTMMALYTALRRPKPLAGVVGFSGALIGEHLIKEEATAKLPICLLHGEEDEVVPFGALAHAEDALKLHGIDVSAHARPDLGHSIDPEGIGIAKGFLKKCFGV
jgi:phospholipase/carboxylesterase